jgi:hypothetical protein
MAGVEFTNLFNDFRSGTFGSLGVMQIIAMVYVLAIAGLGIVAFCCKDKCFSLLFVILLFISFVFTGAVAILGFITGTGIIIS